MIKDLTIQGYRCFTEFRMNDLAQVNLIVGKNNCGKTALLEAIELVSSVSTQPRSLWSSLSRRGEIFPTDDRHKQEYDISHLFNGHEIGMGSPFRISTEDRGKERFVSGTIDVMDDKVQSRLFPEDTEYGGAGIGAPHAMLKLDSGFPNKSRLFPFTSRGGLSPRLFVPDRMDLPSNGSDTTTVFITTDSLKPQTISQYWNSITLTSEEKFVIRALRILDNDIQGISFISGDRSIRRGGVLVKYRGNKYPVPIGSLGDGMWRMLCMAIALVQAREGILLVDEIDTGLHYTVMEEMWKMILKTAKRFDTQVFATTHSSDCLKSLASVCHEEVPGQASVQRLEADKNEAIAYSEGEIWAAARHDIEMR